MLYGRDDRDNTETKMPDGNNRTQKYRTATHLTAFGRLLVGDGLLLPHCRDDSNQQILAVVEVSLDLFAEFAIRNLDVVFGSAVGGHQVKETVIDVNLEEEEEIRFGVERRTRLNAPAGIRYGRR